ncbi:hypothetical protein ACFL2A_05185 [Thermodesulfobacteriota bacterium]
MGIEIFLTVISGLITAIGGLLFATIFRKKTEQDKIQNENLNSIAEVAVAKASEARLKVIDSIASKLPEGGKPEEIERLLESKISIDKNLFINHEDGSLIEGLVDSYHQQALSQAKVQFWFSVIAATVGFIYILFSASSITSNNYESYLKIMPGVIIDAVAFLFFRQAEQTRERATALYDRLRADNQLLKSQSVVESIEDLQIRSAVKAQIALHMSGLKPKEIDLTTFMSQNNNGF